MKFWQKCINGFKGCLHLKNKPDIWRSFHSLCHWIKHHEWIFIFLPHFFNYKYILEEKRNSFPPSICNNHYIWHISFLFFWSEFRLFLFVYMGGKVLLPPITLPIGLIIIPTALGPWPSLIFLLFFLLSKKWLGPIPHSFYISFFL